ILTIKNNEVNLIEIAIAADELQLLEAYKQIENYLLNNKLAWKPKDIITALQNDYFANLYNFALGWTPENFMDLKYTLRIALKVFYQMALMKKFYTTFRNLTPKASFEILPLRGYPFDSKIINAKDAALIGIEFPLKKKQGPCFGLQDLCINRLISPNKVGVICKSRQSYEKKLINEGAFEIEEYEVFLIDNGFPKQ
ncbi:14407_t:CDS:2, partial [Dentiscutata erythropus]